MKVKLTKNSLELLKKRYLLRNERGKIIETPEKMFRRVAKAVAAADKKYGKNPKKAEKEFYEAMSNLEFLPNSPTLMNAGTKLGQLSACFVLPVRDSLTEIFDAIKHMVLIQQSGGGTGFSFSELRPRGDIVRSTRGVASGPVSFMRVFDSATDVIKQGGKRRGANMGILRASHPDIEEFINAKLNGSFTNFNLSVAVDDKFMRAVEQNKSYSLINPRTGKISRKVRARKIFELMVKNAWRTGDPGIIFIDEVNRKNPTPEIGKIEATNPCGEQPLLPFESCNLGSVNLTKMVENGKINWEKLRRTVQTGVHFLDNVIDVNKYPIPQVEKITKANRKIGLGVMGFAELLFLLDTPYNSDKAVKLTEKLMKFITDSAVEKSRQLAKERGAFPNFKGSVWEKKKVKVRNATLTTIAPTGSLSIIAGCSPSIEPLFALAFVRHVLEGARLPELNPVLTKVLKQRGLYSKKLMTDIARKGSLKNLKGIPQDLKKIFITALEIKSEWHIRVQAAFQKYIHNSVSKTINLPENATIADVRKAYLLAYKLKCKSTTVYRYKSKPEQVWHIGLGKKECKRCL